MIHFAVVHLGKSTMDVVMSDRDGHRRKIQVAWAARGPDDADNVPANWVDLAEKEGFLQLSLEADIAAGRGPLPDDY